MKNNLYHFKSAKQKNLYNNRRNSEAIFNKKIQFHGKNIGKWEKNTGSLIDVRNKKIDDRYHSKSDKESFFAVKRLFLDLPRNIGPNKELMENSFITEVHE